MMLPMLSGFFLLLDVPYDEFDRVRLYGTYCAPVATGSVGVGVPLLFARSGASWMRSGDIPPAPAGLPFPFPTALPPPFPPTPTPLLPPFALIRLSGVPITPAARACTDMLGAGGVRRPLPSSGPGRTYAPPWCCCCGCAC